MRIGAFAEKYNMNVSAVRYYVERGLLTPQRRNNQYVFDDDCMKDMEKILRYKPFYFSLSEIELLFFLQRNSQLQDQSVSRQFLELLNKKKLQLNQDLDTLQQTIKDLDEEIYRSTQKTETASLKKRMPGIPLMFLEKLACPHCNAPLQMQNAHLNGTHILDASLSCSCGYHATIQDGILLCTGHTDVTPFKAYENIESVAYITEEYGKEYRSLMEKSYLWMYHQIPQNRDSLTILAGPFTFNFLLQYYTKFDEDTTIIITDPSLSRIAKFQEYLQDAASVIIYIAGDLDAVPLCSGAVDLYLDDFSANNCIFTYNRTPYNVLSHWLAKDAPLIGLFLDYCKTPRSIRAFQKEHPDLMTERMSFSYAKASLQRNGFAVTESKIIGQTSGREMEFHHQVGREKLPFLVYRAERKK